MGYFAIDTSPDLKHYGILGMKWGIRKERQTSGSGKGRRRKRRKRLSLKNINKKIDKGYWDFMDPNGYKRKRSELSYIDGHAGTKEDPIRIKVNINDESDLKTKRQLANQYMSKGYAIRFNDEKGSWHSSQYSPYRRRSK